MQISYGNKPIHPLSLLFSRLYLNQQQHKRKIILISCCVLTLWALYYYWIDLSSLIGFLGGTSSDIYSKTPFCDPTTGICGEKPDIASPRSIYSAKSKQQYELWWKYHEYLNKTAQDYDAATRRSNNNGKIPLVFLGDSITESWLGTDMGRNVDRAKDVPSIYHELFLSDSASSNNFDPIVFAIGGDQTQHLLYRIQNGQLLQADNPKSIYVVLIGTNNVGSGELPDPTTKGVLAVAKYLLENTMGHLILLKVLPRGDDFRTNRICPPRCRSNGKPFQSFMPAIEKLNKGIQDGIYSPSDDDEKHFKNYHPRISLIDCGMKFILKTTGENDGITTMKTGGVDEALMPDYLHPNADGHRILGNCIMETIQKVINV